MTPSHIIASIVITALLIIAGIYGDRQAMDPKVLSVEYDKCTNRIPMLKDSEYKEALKECMNNARVIARAAAR